MRVLSVIYHGDHVGNVFTAPKERFDSQIEVFIFAVSIKMGSSH